MFKVGQGFLCKVTGQPHIAKIVDTRVCQIDSKITKTSSMARTTGFTCTAVANLVLEKKYRQVGISPPEYLGSHFEYIRNYLSDRNVIYKVKKIL